MLDNQKYEFAPYNNILSGGTTGLCSELLPGNLFALKEDGVKYKVLKICDGYIIYQKFMNPNKPKYERSFEHTFYTCLPF